MHMDGQTPAVYHVRLIVELLEKLDEVGDAAPCRISPVGFGAPPLEPDGHLSAYPALRLQNLGLDAVIAAWA